MFYFDYFLSFTLFLWCDSPSPSDWNTDYGSGSGYSSVKKIAGYSGLDDPPWWKRRLSWALYSDDDGSQD